MCHEGRGEDHRGLRHPGASTPRAVWTYRLLTHYEKNADSEGFPGRRARDQRSPLELDSTSSSRANENQIRQKNAGNIKAKIIVEGANGPTTQRADEILNAKGILVVPTSWPTRAAVTVPTSNGSRTAPVLLARDRGQRAARDIMVQLSRTSRAWPRRYG